MLTSYRNNELKGYTLEAMPQVEYQRLPGHAQTHIVVRGAREHNLKNVDLIEGLSPAISIDQKGASRNPRSTVGTITEVYDYMRLLFARVGHPHCPNCGREIRQQTVQEIVDAVQGLPEGSRIMVLAPIIKDRKGEHIKVLEDLRKAGYVRARIDGEVRDLDTPIDLEKYKMHTIEAGGGRPGIHAPGGGGGGGGPPPPPPG